MTAKQASFVMGQGIGTEIKNLTGARPLSGMVEKPGMIMYEDGRGLRSSMMILKTYQ